MADFTPPEEVTGDELADVSIEDISHSLFKVTKDLRKVAQVASSVTLWDVESKDGVFPATVAKKGHHPAVRIMIQQARDYEALAKLEEEAECADMAERIQVAKAKQKALSDLRDSSLQIQRITTDCVKAAHAAIDRLMAMKQAYQMHREKLGKDLKDASDGDLEKIAGPA